MNRRQFVFGFVALTFLAVKANKKFVYKLKTKDKSVISGTIEATDVENAKYKLRQRYKDCEIISIREK